MNVESVRYQNGELCLRCSPPDGIKFVYGFKAGDYDILPHKKEKKKRSLDANAYAWVLINRIAEKVQLAPDEVYRNAVINTPGVTESIVCIAEEAAPAFIRSWESGHLGRQVRQFPANRIGFVNLIVVYGSSDYDTLQMSRFIDGLVQDAQALGIETKDPNEIQSLLNSWEGRNQ